MNNLIVILNLSLIINKKGKSIGISREGVKGMEKRGNCERRIYRKRKRQKQWSSWSHLKGTALAFAGSSPNHTRCCTTQPVSACPPRSVHTFTAHYAHAHAHALFPPLFLSFNVSKTINCYCCWSI